MPIELCPRAIAKPWGVTVPPAPFSGLGSGSAVGEIWFESDSAPAPALAVKRLFTSQRLSVQVHPDAGHARRLGLPHGKDEAWYVLAAAPGAAIGIGLPHAGSRADVAAAARDGRIVEMMEWREVVAGDVLYVPGGTVHALGAGLDLVEIQQAIDLTWRLYDYGRPRPLHLDEGLAVARLQPFGPNAAPRRLGTGRTARTEGGCFVIEELVGQWRGELAATAAAPVWLVMLAGRGQLGEAEIAAGGVWLSQEREALTLTSGARLLLAYEGSAAAPDRLIGDGAL